MTSARPHIAFAMTVPGAVRAFMVPHLLELAKSFDITLYSNFTDDPSADLRARFADMPVRFVHVGFERKIYPLADVKSWWNLFRHLRRDRPASLHSMMPKTGLVATTAGLVAGVPIRIHMFTGQVWASQRGIRRLILQAADRLIAFAATHILADSPSQRDFLLSNGFPDRITVLGAGSVSGVDLERFQPNPEMRKQVRAKYGINDNDLVFGFLGRMNRDKGVTDLLSGFVEADLPSNCHLLLVGPDEENIGRSLNSIETAIKARIYLCGHTNRPEDYLAAFDVYCLPSYREGFGTSVIEAAACGVPALVSHIYGLTDAVAENESGLFHAPGNVKAIAKGLLQFVNDPELRVRLGNSARRRAKQKFEESILIAEIKLYYNNLL